MWSGVSSLMLKRERKCGKRRRKHKLQYWTNIVDKLTVGEKTSGINDYECELLVCLFVSSTINNLYNRRGSHFIISTNNEEKDISK